jgi:hypothetical protein
MSPRASRTGDLGAVTHSLSAAGASLSTLFGWDAVVAAAMAAWPPDGVLERSVGPVCCQERSRPFRCRRKELGPPIRFAPDQGK